MSDLKIGLLIIGTYLIGMVMLMIIAKCVGARPKPHNKFVEFIVEVNNGVPTPDSFLMMLWPAVLFVSAIVISYKTLEWLAGSIAKAICPNQENQS